MWDIDDIHAMIADAEIVTKSDLNAATFCKAIQWRVIEHGMQAALSEQEELRLMTIASKGVRQINAIVRSRRAQTSDEELPPTTNYGGFSKNGA